MVGQRTFGGDDVNNQFSIADRNVCATFAVTLELSNFRTLELLLYQLRSISSSDLPLVSGTKNQTTPIRIRQKTAYR